MVEPITGTISSYIRVYVCQKTQTWIHTNTHDHRMRSEFEHPLCPLNILCENLAAAAAQEVMSVRKDTAVKWALMGMILWAELKEKVKQILHSILIGFRFNKVSFSLPHASWELKTVWQSLDNIHSLPYETLSQLSECTNLCERVSTNGIRSDAPDDLLQDIVLFSDPSIDTGMWVDG